MEGESQSWILMLTGRAPTNIAVIKYWGKRDEKLILPINDSISVTLDPEHLSATATVAVNPSFTSDRMWLNGKEVSLAGERYQNCLREIKSQAKDVVDEKNGIVIRKEDWQSLHLHIASHNNFPTAAGLASSAAGFACLGSGSACRSLYGGFVKWTMGKETDGSDSVAVQLANEKHWEELVVLVAVVSSRQKETSSTTGMRVSVDTSELIHHRSQEVVPKRIVKMEETIVNHDFASFARIACGDSNQFHAVCLDTSPPIFYMNDTSHRVLNSLERWNQFEGTPHVAYTFDAGPNAVMFASNRKVAGCLLQRLLYYFPPDLSKPLSSYVIGDTSILGEIGLKSVGDVESLTAPPELQKGSRHRTFPGAVDYFICTRPGKGPILFRNEDQALLNPKTGFPLESS